MGLFSKLFNLNTNEEYDNKIKDNNDFYMEIEDIFTITGRGTVLVGNIKSGTVYLNDKIYINNIETKVLGIEMFRKKLDYATSGDNVGL
ncbi:MAG: elongation factor Tu, partial [Bacilli bacterium]|nr:elongation factor Tu [Bacilli bacterium]